MDKTDDNKEMTKLIAELEKLEVDHSESMMMLQQKHNQDMGMVIVFLNCPLIANFSLSLLYLVF